MSHNRTQTHHVGRPGWFALGALAASVTFVLLLIAGDYFKAANAASDVEGNMPALIIEAQ